MAISEHIPFIASTLQLLYPKTETFLHYQKDWQLLFATILSAQATDRSVNQATEKLFARFPMLDGYREENRAEILSCIKAVGLSNAKAGYLIQSAKILVEDYNGTLPKDREKLVLLPGCGHKTASVVLAELYDFPYIPVDTHVHRVSARLGIVKEKTSPEKTEERLEKLFQGYHAIHLHRQLILFGRNICHALHPECESCPFLSFCPFGRKRMKVEKPKTKSNQTA